MTVDSLYEKLGKLRAQGHGSCKLYIEGTRRVNDGDAHFDDVEASGDAKLDFIITNSLSAGWFRKAD